MAKAMEMTVSSTTTMPPLAMYRHHWRMMPVSISVGLGAPP